jgi:hypothetical protein
MNADIKKLWVDALRSGEYKQGLGCLKKMSAANQYEYCCLGVLCDLHQKHTHGGTWKDRVSIDTISFYIPNGHGEEKNEAFLPPPVMDWAGLSRGNPEVPYAGAQQTILLSALNDGSSAASFRKLTFEQIADLIDETL